MSIFVVTGWFDVYDKFGIKTGKKEFITSHGIDERTGQNIVLPNEPPGYLGAMKCPDGEWRIFNLKD